MTTTEAIQLIQSSLEKWREVEALAENREPGERRRYAAMYERDARARNLCPMLVPLVQAFLSDTWIKPDCYCGRCEERKLAIQEAAEALSKL